MSLDAEDVAKLALKEKGLLQAANVSENMAKWAKPQSPKTNIAAATDYGQLDLIKNFEKLDI